MTQQADQPFVVALAQPAIREHIGVALVAYKERCRLDAAHPTAQDSYVYAVAPDVLSNLDPRYFNDPCIGIEVDFEASGAGAVVEVLWQGRRLRGARSQLAAARWTRRAGDALVQTQAYAEPAETCPLLLPALLEALDAAASERPPDARVGGLRPWRAA